MIRLGCASAASTIQNWGASLLVHSSTFFVGLTFFHLNQPNISLDKEGDEKLPFEFSFQGGVEYDINRYQKWIIARQFLFISLQ